MAQCGLPRMEGNEGVPLRFPRPSMAPVAVALVAVWVALNSAPALADQVRQSEWWLRELHITTAQQISQGSGVTIAALDTAVDSAAHGHRRVPPARRARLAHKPPPPPSGRPWRTPAARAASSSRRPVMTAWAPAS